MIGETHALPPTYQVFSLSPFDSFLYWAPEPSVLSPGLQKPIQNKALQIVSPCSVYSESFVLAFDFSLSVFDWKHPSKCASKMGMKRAVPGFGYPEVSNCTCMLVCNVVFQIPLGLQLHWDGVLPLAFLVCVEASFMGSNKKLISAFPKRTARVYKTQVPVLMLACTMLCYPEESPLCCLLNFYKFYCPEIS